MKLVRVRVIPWNDGFDFRLCGADYDGNVELSARQVKKAFND